MLHLVLASYLGNIYLDGLMVCMHGALEDVFYTQHYEGNFGSWYQLCLVSTLSAPLDGGVDESILWEDQ